MANGYRVIGCSKIFHYRDPDSWHEYYPTLENPDDLEPFPENVPLSGIADAGLLDWGPVDWADEDSLDGQRIGWAIQQLDQAYNQPFFLAVGVVRPHLPWYAPTPYFDMYPPESIKLPIIREDDREDVPTIGKLVGLANRQRRLVMEHNRERDAVAAYLACISFADALVGKVLQALEASPYADNTIVVLCGDNGYHLGEKQHWGKKTCWEEATHVPLIIAAPDLTRAGERCTRSVSLLDIYPTLIDLCNLNSMPGLEGTSLLPLLRNPQSARHQPAITTVNEGQHTVRTETWRYIHYEDATEELYDHVNDPNEWTNLANDRAYAVVKAELARWLP
jgi:arylsulfatase A-like enzyme